MAVELSETGRAGMDWSMPFDAVLGTFGGDWKQAAAIYRDCAQRQPWCAKKISERDDIPAWLKAGRRFVCLRWEKPNPRRTLVRSDCPCFASSSRATRRLWAAASLRC